ncbi:uncharacterized protein LOC116805791 [Drosophila grimshawi]|uniref:uncharacterized protein LOC116805791 n=1 Tax=Drosophila grimshawi TaxID=7222 RepID=UPI0013EF213B|nr:uncharacterized protein LOC116805791 [Drosophila grimshawi]
MQMPLIRKTTFLLLYLLIIGECFGCRSVYKPPMKSCFRMGGRCREVYACKRNQHATVKTNCVLRRKVCCMRTPQQ